MTVHHREDPPVVMTTRREAGTATLVILHFGANPADVALPAPAGTWIKRLDSAAERWRGGSAAERAAERLPGRFRSTGQATLPLAARNVAMYVREAPAS